jgi:hypothetical protein
VERLAALVPRAKVHLTRYHGALDPHAKHRKQIVPKPPELKVIGQDQDIIDPKQLELKRKIFPGHGCLQKSSITKLRLARNAVET